MWSQSQNIIAGLVWNSSVRLSQPYSGKKVAEITFPFQPKCTGSHQQQKYQDFGRSGTTSDSYEMTLHIPSQSPHLVKLALTKQ